MAQSETGKIGEVIGYIFTHLTDRAANASDFEQYFKTRMRQELEEAGFDKELIDHSISWLNGLLEQQLLGFLRGMGAANFPNIHNQQAVRCFSVEERIKLSNKVRGLLHQLDQDGVLDWITREIIITQLMRLDQNVVGLEDFYWVVFMVVCSSLSKSPKTEQREYLKRLLAMSGQTER